MAKKKVDNFQEGVKLELDGTKYQPTLSVTQEEKVQETELKQPEPSVRVETTTAANPRLAKRQENANAYLDALAAKEKELGRTLTKQEIADWDDPKGLFAYQSLNNKKGNWANAFGANSLWGSFNDDTYKMLRKDLDSRSEQTKQKLAQDNKADRVVAVVPMVGGSTRAVTRGQQIAHQNLGNTITDANNLSPEQANAIVGILRKDHTIPEDIKFEGNTTLASVLDQLDDYVSDEELQALGYYNDEMVATVPHKETYEEMMARREKAEEAMRLQSQQKALARQQARLGLADLAAGIGDIIKASGGALVDKRSYQDMYNQLTAQQQKNFDGYLARMEALKQEEKAKAKLAEERAYNEKLQATLHERDMEKILQAQGFQASEADKGRKHQAAQSENERIWRSKESEKQRSHEMDMLMKKLEAEAKELEDKLGAEAAKNVTKGRKIYINNKELPANDDLYGELYAYFTTFGSRKYTTKDGKQAVLNFDKLKTEEFNTEDSKVAIALQVQKALRDYSSFNDNMKSQIMSLILQEDTPISSEGASGSTTVTNTKNGLGRFGQQ